MSFRRPYLTPEIFVSEERLTYANEIGAQRLAAGKRGILRHKLRLGRREDRWHADFWLKNR